MCLRRRKCWLRKWHDAFRRLLPGARVHDTLVSLSHVDVNMVEDSMLDAYNSTLVNWGDPLQIGCAHRRMAMSALLLQQCEWGRRPQQLAWVVAPTAKQIWIDFICANAALPAHDYALCRAGQHDTRLCTKCDMHEPGDEAHVLLRCPTTQFARNTYTDKLIWTTNFRFFVQLNVQPDFAHFVVTALKHYWRSQDIT